MSVLNKQNKGYADIKRIKGVRWLLLWVMLTQFVVKVATSAVVSFIPKTSAGFERYSNYIQLGIVTILTFLIPIMVYGMTAWKKTERADAEEMRFNRFSPKLVGFIVVMAISGQFVIALLNLPLGTLFGAHRGGLEPLSLGEVVVAILVTAVLPGILEEFWMRGIVLSVYERRSTFVAIFFTTIMFALLHGNFVKLPGFLLLGFIAAVITIRTNSVYAAMLYHIVNNATSVLYAYIDANYPIGDVFAWTFFAIMIPVFIASLVCFLVVSPKRKRAKCKREGSMLMKNFFSIPVILCFVLVYLKIKFY